MPRHKSARYASAGQRTRGRAYCRRPGGNSELRGVMIGKVARMRLANLEPEFGPAVRAWPSHLARSMSSPRRLAPFPTNIFYVVEVEKTEHAGELVVTLRTWVIAANQRRPGARSSRRAMARRQPQSSSDRPADRGGETTGLPADHAETPSLGRGRWSTARAIRWPWRQIARRVSRAIAVTPAHSGRTRAPIPVGPGHRFRYDAGAKSGATRALIPV